MKTLAKVISVAAMALVFGGIATPTYAQQPWSALPGGCASTDNNFHNDTPSSSYPVARYRTPGGTITHNAFHDGYIAVICNVDNPRAASTTPRWNRLQVTYVDPDGLDRLDGTGRGTEYQAYAELFRISKATGAWSRIVVFDSNLQCATGTTGCTGSNEIKSITVPFTHTFDFNNYSYAVYGRLYRGIAIYNLRPALYQLRLQAQ